MGTHALIILHIDCSPRPQSLSRKLSGGIVARLVATHPDARVMHRDLGLVPIPHAGDSYADALSSPAALASGQQGEVMRLSDQLIAELEAANVVVIGTPMHNFTVPSVLKAWIDQIVRIGRTFAATANGKTGLLRDRPVYVGVASGGTFSGDHASQPDFLTPYMRAAPGCVGLGDVRFLTLQGTAFLDAGQIHRAHDALLAALDETRLVTAD